MILSIFAGGALGVSVYNESLTVPDSLANALIFLAAKTPLGGKWMGASILAGLITFCFLMLLFETLRWKLLVRAARHRQSLAERAQKNTAPQRENPTDQLRKLYK